MDRGKFSSIFASAILVGLLAWMTPGSASAFFSAPLVQCQSVTVPAALSNCGTDPLTAGSASIDDEGDLEISIAGAATRETYAVVFEGADGSRATLTPTLETGAGGSGLVRSPVLFPIGKVGAGNIVLTRAGNDQFVTGIAIEAAMGNHAREDFRPELVSCSAVNQPGAITGCGTDAFKNGHVEVDAADGDLNVQVTGAAAATTYAVVLRSGATSLALGNLVTNSHGVGQLVENPETNFPAGTIAAGIVVLTQGGSDQAYSGFRSSLKPRPRPASTSGLVPCAEATFGSPSTSACGTDPLTSGSAVLGQHGVLKVDLTGAAPSTTYEVFFRPINDTASSDVDAMIAITTDANGNGKGSGTVGPSGIVGSGNFVIKEGDTDEFLTGFTIR